MRAKFETSLRNWTRFRINSSLISILSYICTHTHSDKGRGISENLIPQNVNNYWILFTA